MSKKCIIHLHFHYTRTPNTQCALPTACEGSLRRSRNSTTRIDAKRSCHSFREYYRYIMILLVCKNSGDNTNMEFCVLAKIVIILSIVSIVFHLCIFGLTVWLFADILTMALFIFITNRYCDHWIAKVLVGFATISTITYYYLCYTTNKIYISRENTPGP